MKSPGSNVAPGIIGVSHVVRKIDVKPITMMISGRYGHDTGEMSWRSKTLAFPSANVFASCRQERHPGYKNLLFIERSGIHRGFCCIRSLVRLTLTSEENRR